MTALNVVQYARATLGGLAMGAAQKFDWEVTRLAGAIGAEIRGVALASADAEQVAEIKRLLLEHMVVFFPDQQISVDEHAFGSEAFSEVAVLFEVEDPQPQSSRSAHNTRVVLFVII